MCFRKRRTNSDQRQICRCIYDYLVQARQQYKEQKAILDRALTQERATREEALTMARQAVLEDFAAEQGLGSQSAAGAKRPVVSDDFGLSDSHKRIKVDTNDMAESLQERMERLQKAAEVKALAEVEKQQVSPMNSSDHCKIAQSRRSLSNARNH